MHTDIFSFPLSIAPMMRLTDRHFRYFMRAITKHTILYTEMITTSALLYGKRHRLLTFAETELPLVLQLGGNAAEDLKSCAKMAQDRGYSAVNINAGCPSLRVQEGSFGINLMQDPDYTADLFDKINNAVSIPVSIKHRLGIGQEYDYEKLYYFVNRLAQANCRHFIIHARPADFTKDAKQNRIIPPLLYDPVYRLKDEFPECIFELNGGITTLKKARDHLQSLDRVMIGRAAYSNPYLFALADSCFGDNIQTPPSRRQIIRTIQPYVELRVSEGIKPITMLRHLMGLFRKTPAARRWRQGLSQGAQTFDRIDRIFSHALARIPSHILDHRPNPL